MKRNTKMRILSMALVAAMAIGSLAGCVSEAPAESSSAPAASSEAASDSGEASSEAATGDVTEVKVGFVWPLPFCGEQWRG